MVTTLRGHARIDARSLAMHRTIAEKLRTQPELVDIAMANLNRWMESASHSRPYFEAWLEILSRPIPEVIELLVEDSERMTAMRQIAPFAGVLTPRKRWATYRDFQEERV